MQEVACSPRNGNIAATAGIRPLTVVRIWMILVVEDMYDLVLGRDRKIMPTPSSGIEQEGHQVGDHICACEDAHDHRQHTTSP